VGIILRQVALVTQCHRSQFEPDILGQTRYAGGGIFSLIVVSQLLVISPVRRKMSFPPVVAVESAGNTPQTFKLSS
jgi:hypothetical protein